MTGRYAAYTTAAKAIEPHLLFEETQRLLSSWLGLWDPGADDVPDRHDLDPTLFPKTLSRLYLIDYVQETDRLRYRLAGEEVNRRYTTSIVGKHLDEISDPDAYPRIAAYFKTVFERPAIVLLSGLLYSEREKPGYGERLLLPIRDGQTGQPGIIGLTYQRLLYSEADIAERATGRMLRIADLTSGRMTESDSD